MTKISRHISCQCQQKKRAHIKFGMQFERR